jgi:hypothetical protein
MLLLAQAVGGEHFARQRRFVAERPGGGYGLGLAYERIGDLEMWGHEGSWNGWRSTLLTIPTESIALVVLAKGATTARPVRELADYVLATSLGARRVEPTTILLGEHERGVFSGSYANGSCVAVVQPSGTGISLAVTEDGTTSTLHAEPTGLNTFVIRGGVDDGAQFDFPLLASGSYALRLRSQLMLRQAA